MSSEQLVSLLSGRRGHFAMESGYHSQHWYQLDRLMAQREQLRPFVAELARRLAKHEIQVICGPVTGGAQLAEMIGLELGLPWVIAERFETPAATGLFPIRYTIPAAQRKLIRGQRVAIVDDAVSAGSAVRGTYADVLACGGRPVAVGALFVFGDAAAEFAAWHHLQLEGIAPLPLGIWRPEECPLCREGLPVERVSDAV